MAGPDRARILIVDDESSVREVLGEYFTDRGYTVDAASDGEAALATVQRVVPDLVLLDVRMPGMDGVETLRRIRAVAPALAVIMVTANEDVTLARETLKLGALDYVGKPFDFVYLERAVGAAVARAGAGPPAAPAAPAGDPWHDLALAVFHAVRGMKAGARASTGTRLEDAALAVARQAAAGRLDGDALAGLELLLSLAAELRDLAGTELGAVRSALERARLTLPGRR
jgi:two-component system response regulator (stage 0 sporulation protein F)